MVWGVAKGKPWPDAKIRHLLTFVSLTAVIMSNPTLGGDFYLGLLAVMAGLKPMEMRSHRDRMITAFLAYFIVIAGLFKSETLFITLYMFVSVLVTTAVMIRLNHSQPMRQNIRLARQIMMQAAPLMVVLFLLFPRIQGSLWGIRTSHQGFTGFSGSLELGDIAQLVRNDKIAFRAEFSQTIPSPERLYWRGIVFDTFNGRSWNPVNRALRRLEPVKGKDLLEYTITLEPHGRHWVFALDMPIDGKGMGQRVGPVRDDLTLRTYRRVKRKARFTLKSYTIYNTGPWREWEVGFKTLPVSGNLKALALARRWKEQGLSPERKIDAALDFFRDQSFVYTLKPPPLKKDVIDTFLFETRKGYCEHYASAFVFLMRAAGVPARVVGGYLGGRKNPYGDFLIVRQADAHAWAEVWLPGKGWFRVDPTAIVAPERITQGIAGALAFDEIPSFLADSGFGRIGDYWQEIRFGWEAVNLQWDVWFSGYSYFEQKALLAKIGVETLNRISQMKLLATATALAVLAAFIFFMRQLLQTVAPANPVRRIYQQFCAKMERKGLPRRPAEGPRDYADRMIASYGEFETDLERERKRLITEITDLYIKLRYAGDESDRDTLHLLKARINRI